MGRVYGMYGEKRYWYRLLVRKTLKEENHLGRLRIGVSLIVQCILKEIGCEGMDWISVAKDRAFDGLLWARQ